MNALLQFAPAIPVNAAPLLWARYRVAVAYWWRHGHWPDLDQPRRFTEWVQWRKLHDRSAARALLTDKLHAKALARTRIGGDKVVPLLWEGRELPATSPWPFPFVVKSNHGCGDFAVVRDVADYRQVRRSASQWLRRTYGRWLDEWHYQAARPTLIVEPFLGGVGAALPLDYKVYVFGGIAQIVQVHTGRAANHRWTQYDRSWRTLSKTKIDVPAPACLEEMLAAAETLAADEDFLRVDFYCVDGRLYFGEFCLYPGSGLDPFEPDELDLFLGDCWTDAIRRRAAKCPPASALPVRRRR